MKLLKSITTYLCAMSAAVFAAEPPAPYGPVPTKQQVEWLRMEWYAFVHFGINTFTNKEWGYGDEDPKLFNPTGFDADAIVSVFKQAGMKGMIYTAKHHDGFCLWPTQTTEHNITKSPWKGGKGDVVREFAEACAKQSFKFGTYLSPWDRNHAEYGRPGYLKTYYAQITELLTNYGPIFEIWFDGANGGDGYYGGAKERRSIGKDDQYYNFPEVVKMIRELQPNCIIWGAALNGDVTWGGSEKGHIADRFLPVWNVTKDNKWISLEADTTINHAGWFWHPNSADRVKSPELLMDRYMKSVGVGANLILNVAPGRDGHLDAADVNSLLIFGEMRRRLLANDFALGAKVKASEVRGDDANFAGDRVTDGHIDTYWCPEDETRTGELVITLPKPATFDVVRLREQIRLGQRVKGFQVDVWEKNDWKTIIPDGKTIGHQIMRQLSEPVTTKKIRVRITNALACPCISEVSLLRMPQVKDVQVAKLKPVNNKVSLQFIERKGWHSLTPGGQAALDGKPKTHWLSKEDNQLSVDMGKEWEINGFSYLPRQDGKQEHMTDRYRFEVSKDGNEWTEAASGEFSNLAANPIELRVYFEQPVKVRYFRFTGERALQGEGASAAELKVFKLTTKK